MYEQGTHGAGQATGELKAADSPKLLYATTTDSLSIDAVSWHS